MFFDFRQNNSGGGFDVDESRGISCTVIVEADDYEAANDRAEAIGLYFDGDGDCPCCGDRWSAQWRGESGTEVPSLYGTPLVEVKDAWNWAGGRPETFVHLQDGRVFGFHVVDGKYVYKGDPADLAEALPAAPKAIGPEYVMDASHKNWLLRRDGKIIERIPLTDHKKYNAVLEKYDLVSDFGPMHDDGTFD